LALDRASVCIIGVVERPAVREDKESAVDDASSVQKFQTPSADPPTGLIIVSAFTNLATLMEADRLRFAGFGIVNKLIPTCENSFANLRFNVRNDPQVYVSEPGIFCRRLPRA
jgi:hypothetical protein